MGGTWNIHLPIPISSGGTDFSFLLPPPSPHLHPHLLDGNFGLQCVHSFSFLSTISHCILAILGGRGHALPHPHTLPFPCLAFIPFCRMVVLGGLEFWDLPLSLPTTPFPPQFGWDGLGSLPPPLLPPPPSSSPPHPMPACLHTLPVPFLLAPHTFTYHHTCHQECTCRE